jgi:pimeloyl-ACP methyl ester carboxylesterase
LLTTKFIEEAGHVTFMEKPAEFNVILLEWIKDVTKA